MNQQMKRPRNKKRASAQSQESLAVDELCFAIRRSARRKTLQITIERDGSLLIAAPTGLDLSVMEDFVREKQLWIYTKLAEKEALQQPVRAKEFVNGEGFSYLGRSYRLLLVEEQDRPLKLIGGRFRLLRSEVDQGREVFLRWYKDHALAWIKKRMRQWTDRLEVEPAGIAVRELGYRWGSCTKSGKVHIHWLTILLPARMVEYVLVHELIHLHEPNHSPAFWRRLERAMPDYEDRKAWLAENGMNFFL